MIRKKHMVIVCSTELYKFSYFGNSSYVMDKSEVKIRMCVLRSYTENLKGSE